MQVNRMHAQRGQALIETAIFLPAFLLILFGMMWVAQFSVVNERAQVAVRYSGLISNEASPYDGFSLYAIYNNVGGRAQAATTTCATPPPDAFTNNPANGAFPGPISQRFWQPSNVDVGTCNAGRLQITDQTLTVPMLLVNTYSKASAEQTAAAVMPSELAGLQTTGPLVATQNFVNTPDIASIMQCYPQLSSAVANSIDGETSPGSSPVATAPLGAINSTTPITLSNPC